MESFVSKNGNYDNEDRPPQKTYTWKEIIDSPMCEGTSIIVRLVLKAKNNWGTAPLMAVSEFMEASVAFR